MARAAKERTRIGRRIKDSKFKENMLFSLFRRSDTPNAIQVPFFSGGGAAPGTILNTSLADLNLTGVDDNPLITIFRNDETPNDGDVLGVINFRGLDSTGAEFIYAQINAVSEDITDATEDGTINISVSEAGILGSTIFAVSGGVMTARINATNQFTFKDGEIAPVTDDDVDLGTSGLKFKDLYIDGTAFIDTASVVVFSTALTPSANETLDIGTSSLAWKDVWLSGDINRTSDTSMDNVWDTTGTLADDTILTRFQFRALDGAGTPVIQTYAEITTVMESDVDTTEDGSMLFRVMEAGTPGVDYINLNDASDGNIKVFKDIVPNADNTINLGSSSLRWKDIYLDSGFNASKLFFDGGGDSYMTGSATSGRINIFNDNVNTIQFVPDGMRAGTSTEIAIQVGATDITVGTEGTMEFFYIQL